MMQQLCMARSVTCMCVTYVTSSLRIYSTAAKRPEEWCDQAGVGSRRCDVLRFVI